MPIQNGWFVSIVLGFKSVGEHDSGWLPPIMGNTDIAHSIAFARFCNYSYKSVLSEDANRALRLWNERIVGHGSIRHYSTVDDQINLAAVLGRTSKLRPC